MTRASSSAFLIVLAFAAVSEAQVEVRQLAFRTNDLIYDPSTQRIYASVPGSAGSLRGNTITRINPTTGDVEASIFVGSEPNRLALSGNGQFLYVGLDGAAAFRRFDLSTQTAGPQYTVGNHDFWGPLIVDDIEVLPDDPFGVAISRRPLNSSIELDIAAYDSGIARARTAPGGNEIEFGVSPTRLYNFTANDDFRRMVVNASGVTTIESTRNLIGGADFEFDGGFVFSNDGRVIDPESRVLLGTYSGVGLNALVRPASDQNRVYFLSGTSLLTYDLRTFVLLATTPIAGISGTTSSLIRWGSNGLAFRTGSGQLFLISFDIVPSAPEILVQPANQTIPAGDVASFLAVAAGDPSPAVQWQVSSDGGASFVNVTGATSPIYFVTTSAADSGKRFRAVFTNPSGSATTNSALLTACAIVLTPPSVSFGSSSARSAVSVTASHSACAWTATTSATWLTVTSGVVGTGSGSVAYDVTSNSSNVASRTGAVTIGGQTHTVTQAGSTSSCSYSLSQTNAAVGPDAGTATINITTSNSSCPWTATSNASWLSVISGASGTGNGAITYSWLANTSTLPRSGSLQITGSFFNVTQAGATDIPTNLRIRSIVGNQVTIVWNPPVSAPSAYVLEGGTVPGEVLASLPTGGTATIFSFTAPTGEFYIRIRAVYGATRSLPSNEVRIHVNVPVAPSAPARLLALVNGSSVTLSWTNTADGGPVTSLLLNVSGARSASVPLPASETVTFNGVPPGSYTVNLAAINDAGSSIVSNAVSFTVPGTCTGAPGIPANFSATRQGNTISVWWDSPSFGPAVTSYRVTVTGAFTGDILTTDRLLAGTVGPGSYTISVAAINTCGASAPTAPQTVVVP
jgi:hypothetical protein